jgi:hypothetical protein
MENELSNSATLEVPLDFANERYEFFAKKAEVVSEPNIWSETHINHSVSHSHSHSVSDFSIRSSSKVNSNVSSQSVERQRYFVQFSDGKEEEIRDCVGARKGSIIYAIYGGFENQNMNMVATYNLQTQNYLLTNPRFFHKYFVVSYLKLIGKILALILLLGFLETTLLYKKGEMLNMIVAYIFMICIIYLIIKTIIDKYKGKKMLNILNNSLINFINTLH